MRPLMPIHICPARLMPMTSYAMLSPRTPSRLSNLDLPHGGLPSGTNSSSCKRRGSRGALEEVASPTRTCQSDYELLAGVDGVRKILGLRPKRAAKLEHGGRDRPLNDTVTCGTDLSRAMCTAPQGFSGSRHLSNVSTPHSSPRTPPNDNDHDLRGEGQSGSRFSPGGRADYGLCP